MTPNFYASLSGALRGALLSLKYNRELAYLLDNDAAKLKALEAIVDTAIIQAEKQSVKEIVDGAQNS
jgi:hypothetical protein